jgi:hypothetical protein
MAYIGRPLQVANLAVQSGTGDGSDTTPIATLDYATTTNGIAVYLDGVRQLAGTDFNVTAQTTLTFTTAPANGVGVDVYFLGLELSLPTPADGTVATAKIADDAVTLAKMAPGTDGNIISYDASGNPVAVATGSSGQVLTSGGAGAAPSFAAAAAGGKILQIQSVFGGAAATSTTGSTWIVCGSTRTITMSSTSNKILIMACGNLYIGAGGTFPQLNFSVRRTISGGATTSNVTDLAAFYYDARSTGTGRGQEQTPGTTLGLDAPNSTDELTYQCEFKITGTGYSGTAGVSLPISLVLMEVDFS